MAGDGRTQEESLIERVAAKPWSFDFYQIVRRLEAMHEDRPRLGETTRPSQETIRFGQYPSLGFAPASVHRLEPARDGRPPKLLVNFTGLLGPHGPMPLHITQYIVDRVQNHHDNTLPAFLDIFHHRMISLFYRAWATCQPTVNRDRPEDDLHATFLRSLIGLGFDSLQSRDSVSDDAKMYFAGRLGVQTGNAEGLEAILGEFFDVPTELEMFIGQWVDLTPEDRCYLGGPGDEVFEEANKLRRLAAQRKRRVAPPYDVRGFSTSSTGGGDAESGDMAGAGVGAGEAGGGGGAGGSGQGGGEFSAPGSAGAGGAGTGPGGFGSSGTAGGSPGGPGGASGEGGGFGAGGGTSPSGFGSGSGTSPSGFGAGGSGGGGLGQPSSGRVAHGTPVVPSSTTGGTSGGASGPGHGNGAGNGAGHRGALGGAGSSPGTGDRGGIGESTTGERGGASGADSRGGFGASSPGGQADPSGSGERGQRGSFAGSPVPGSGGATPFPGTGSQSPFPGARVERGAGHMPGGARPSQAVLGGESHASGADAANGDKPHRRVHRIGEKPTTGVLGQTALVGSRFWDVQQKFRVVMGPLELVDYERLLPCGESFDRLCDWVKNYIGVHLNWELRLILHREHVPRMQLGGYGHLGWTSWLTNGPLEKHADELLIQIPAA